MSASWPKRSSWAVGWLAGERMTGMCAKQARPRQLGAALLIIGAMLLAGHPSPTRAADAAFRVTIGESNTATQTADLLDHFGTKEEDVIATVTLDEATRAMKGFFDLSGITSAYSSTALRCDPAGSGLTVTTRNITVVPASLYALVLTTAGIDDATLAVAAPADAPGQGMTALTGVFATWENAPCQSGSVDAGRQRSALAQLGLAAEIGMALDRDDGMELATNIVMETQKQIIVDGVRSPESIDDALAGQESAFEVNIPADRRDDLITLLTRIATQTNEWGTFAPGWTLNQDATDTRVTMSAVEPLRAAEVATNQHATPPAVVSASPSPTAEASPSPVSGTISDRGGNQILGVEETGRTSEEAATSAAGDGGGVWSLDRLWPALGAVLVVPLLLLRGLRRNGRVVGYLLPSSSVVGRRLPRSRQRTNKNGQWIIRFRSPQATRRPGRGWLPR